MQHTLKTAITCTGVGLHSGDKVTMVLHPAIEDHGIVFKRIDLEGSNMIPALWNYVTDTKLCTVISNDRGASVGTIEHIMAALRGCGVDNALIEIDGAEVPVMDGSSIAFVEMIDNAGLRRQEKHRRGIKVLKDIKVEHKGKTITLRPSDKCSFTGSIEFDHPTIGCQSYGTKLVNGNFRHDIAQARTFGFLHEVEWMKSNGLAKGGSLDNAIVLGEDGVMNPDGLRFGDEFIRHKILDAIGDLFLAGGAIIGEYEGFKAGHALNNQVLRALFSDKEAWEIIDLDENYAPLNQGRQHQGQDKALCQQSSAV